MWSTMVLIIYLSTSKLHTELFDCEFNYVFVVMLLIDSNNIISMLVIYGMFDELNLDYLASERICMPYLQLTFLPYFYFHLNCLYPLHDYKPMS